MGDRLLKPRKRFGANMERYDAIKFLLHPHG